MFFPVAVLACTACRSLPPLRLSGAALPRSRPSSFTSSPLALPHLSPVAILHRQRAFRAGSRLLPARPMRECHPPKSPVFRLLRPLHLCSRLPDNDIDFHDVIKYNHLYRQPPPSPHSQPAKSHSGWRRVARFMPYFIPHPPSLILPLALVHHHQTKRPRLVHNVRR